ncbi:MAG TPA: acyl-CoA dehydrogenase family protein [Rubrobacter sp.]
MTEAHEDLRRGVREVCSCFPNEYWRDLDERRRYPEEFVVAMTDAGYLGALIPEEYGGMGLDLSAGCAILEEVNRSGANAGPAHAQMYTMGTLLRHGSEEQKGEYLPKDSERRSEAAGLHRHRARSRNRHDLHKDNGNARRRPLHRARAQDLHLQGRAV